jgi:putative Ca2+/H+ antiporter (TMEM165/GDT1 family)
MGSAAVTRTETRRIVASSDESWMTESGISFVHHRTNEIRLRARLSALLASPHRPSYRRRPRMSFEPFVVSAAIVAVAEMGDKTQLLAFVLAARLRRKLPIIVGILVATLANHALAASIGAWLARLVTPLVLTWTIGLAFVAFGLWTLRPDEPADHRERPGAGVFMTTLVAFFLVEMGDKTQLATVALAARYAALASVVAGTTLGMMLANVPAVWMGEALADRVNMRVMRGIAAASFVALGALTLVRGVATP